MHFIVAFICIGTSGADATSNCCRWCCCRYNGQCAAESLIDGRCCGCIGYGILCKDLTNQFVELIRSKAFLEAIEWQFPHRLIATAQQILHTLIHTFRCETLEQRIAARQFRWMRTSNETERFAWWRWCWRCDGDLLIIAAAVNNGRWLNGWCG